MTFEKAVLQAAERGNLTRYREKGAWVYAVDGKRVSRKPVLSLLRGGLLEAKRSVGLWPQIVHITERGREALK